MSVKLKAPAGFLPAEIIDEGAASVLFTVTPVVRDERDAGAHAHDALCKRLSTRACDDAGARARLVDEARVLRALDGRGAPRWIEAGEDDAGPWVVMQHVAAASLAARFALLDASTTSTTSHDAAWIARATIAALAALARVHDAADASGPLEIVHADVSPANLLVAEDASSAWLVDFGLARWRDGSADERASDGAFRGSLLYAAPELCRGEPFDARADLFALAASLLHAASASREAPRPSGLAQAALLVVAGEQPIEAWARRAAHALPRAVGDVLVACVAFDANERPAAARDALARAKSAA